MRGYVCRTLAVAWLVASAQACAPAAASRVAPPPPPTVVAADTAVAPVAKVRDELFFGRRIGDRRIVSEREWRAFVDSVVTPRFPEGLTVVDGGGQWRDRETRALVREPSKVLILLHDGGPEAERAIREIIADYRRRFDQQSVMRVTSTVLVTF